jgi:hypothetical protein
VAVVDFASEYIEHLSKQGYGRQDRRPSERPGGFLSRLQGLSRALQVRVCPATLHCTDDVLRLANAARQVCSKRAVRGYVPAMVQYVGMVGERGLWADPDEQGDAPGGDVTARAEC